jgi:hypothetical protein
MEEQEFEQEVSFYREAIADAVAHVDLRFSWATEIPELLARFNALAQKDLTLFRLLCARLLGDKQREVRLGIRKLLSASKIKDHVLSMVLAEIALKKENLKEETLFALWSVGTRIVLPQLFLLAEQGYSTALYMVRRMVRTPEEIERGIMIARKYIDAEEYALREAALFLLQMYSSMDQEFEGVLSAVLKYKDELFIDALKKAPSESVLEILKELRSTIGEGYAEYGDLSSTLHKLEQKRKMMS